MGEVGFAQSSSLTCCCGREVEGALARTACWAPKKLEVGTTNACAGAQSAAAAVIAAVTFMTSLVVVDGRQQQSSPKTSGCVLSSKTNTCREFVERYMNNYYAGSGTKYRRFQV